MSGAEVIFRWVTAWVLTLVYRSWVVRPAPTCACTIEDLQMITIAGVSRAGRLLKCFHIS